nr:MAG TPA: hypothetical protein [Caudoviricetes sp.]
MLAALFCAGAIPAEGANMKIDRSYMCAMNKLP